MTLYFMPFKWSKTLTDYLLSLKWRIATIELYVFEPKINITSGILISTDEVIFKGKKVGTKETRFWIMWIWK